MSDFILQDRRFLAYYIGLWFFTTTGLFLVLQATTGWSLAAIATDSVVSSFTLYLVLLSLWYVVRFSGGYSVQTPGKLAGTFLAALVLVAVWASIAMGLLELITGFETGYAQFVKKTLWIRGLIGFLLSVIVNLLFYNFYLIAYSREAMERETQLKELMQRTELQALKNQLNPHFIYNSLNSISSLTLTAPDKARDMVIRLSDFLRYALKQDAMQMTPLEKELEYIDSYLQIEKVRFGAKLSYSLACDPELKNLAIPVMLLQPLFENAVKHGLQKSTRPFELTFETEKREGEVVLRVKNSFDKEFARFRREGVGLENIRNRLRLIYGNGNLLKLSTEEAFFIASLSLPNRYYDENN